MSRLRKGTMLMEAVMTVPIVIVAFLACFQFIMIAYAKLMTEHAAHVALRVAEVQCTADRERMALSAARRILAPVSWSMTTIDLAEYKSKIPSSVSKLTDLASLAPDVLDLSFVDVPEDARQPLSWFPIWNSGWLNDQVKIVELTQKNVNGVPELVCTVEFKCPLHVPVIAHLLQAAHVAETFTPKVVFGKREGPADTPCIVLKATAFRLLSHKDTGSIMPPVRKGGFTGT